MLESMRPEMLKRYKDLAVLLWKYGRGDWVDKTDIARLIERDEEENPSTAVEARPLEGTDGDENETDRAEQLKRDLENLGPTYVKLGQVLATRTDVLPKAYQDALSKLHDEVRPVPFEEVAEIFVSDLDAGVDEAFAVFDTEPLAAASLGQVHRAKLGNSHDVVVKIQRPGIRQQIALDMEAIRNVAEILDDQVESARRLQVLDIVNEFERSLSQELDYRKEAENMRTLAENLEEFERIVVPRPVAKWSTSRVLTMQYIDGVSVDDLADGDLSRKSRLDLAEELFHAYLVQILDQGFYHADPHPGNVLITPERKVGLIDVGMVGRVNPDLRQRLLSLLMAITDERSEEAANIALKIGTPTDDFDLARMRERVDRIVQMSQVGKVKDLGAAEMVLEICHAAAESGLRLPPTINLLAKTLANLGSIGRHLAPDFDPNASIRRHASKLVQRRMQESLSLQQLFRAVIDAKDFVERLPDRMGRIMDAVADNKLKLQVDAIDEDRLITGLNKIANRLTVGMVIAALIVGAAIMMHIETSFTLFGYPGLAIICFLFATIIGMVLVMNVLFKDYRD